MEAYTALPECLACHWGLSVPSSHVERGPAMEVPHCRLVIFGDLDPYAGRVVESGEASEVGPMKASERH